ncbi:DivIVA domain-containing protein [Micromonospora endolithica]|uniref:DivIVA domain-containing protein n=1 Tax=Micromonospora endolithica TaxID=230091 RepID=UPI0011ADA646|nr:hypothetical protein JD76_00628 [Micromonospora endolithica]
MPKRTGTAAVLFGLGVGVAVGPSLGPAAVWSGVVVAVLGVGLSLIGSAESDLVGDDLEDDEAAGDSASGTGPAVVAQRRRRDRQAPRLSGLGTRVEQILRLAEEQANDHRDEARREAEEMVSAARREAEAILDRAHEQAAGITGTGRDPAPAPSARTPAAEDDPGSDAVLLEGQRGMGTYRWKGRVNGILYGIQFDRVLDDGTVTRVADHVVRGLYPGRPAEVRDALTQALRYEGPLNDEMRVPHTEESIRAFLDRLAAALAARA